MKPTKLGALAATAIFGWATQSQAATITWDSSNSLTGASDVLANSSTSATVLAYVPDGASVATVNGISFSAAATQSGITLGTSGTGAGFGTDIANQMDGVTSIGGSTPYATMLGSASYYYANPGNTATLTLSLSGLTNNQDYQIRLWAADYRPDQSGRTETVGGLTLDYDDSSGSHSGGNYVIGTFAAGGTSQAFTLTSGAGSPSGFPSAQFNAFQLAAIPGSFHIGDVATVTGGTDWSAPTSSGTTATLSGSGNVSGGNVTINSGGTLEFTDAATLDSGNFSGAFANSGTLSMASSADQTLSGSITGSGALTKSGSGTLTLSGTNSYTGTTAVNAGKLLINGNSSGATGAVTVASGATLGGTGTVGGATTIQSGGHLAVGNSTGTQTFSSTLTFDSGSIFEWDLNAGTTNTETSSNQGTYDKVIANGTVTGTSAFTIALGANAYTDPFWDTNKSWTDIFSGSGSFNLASIFTTINGTGITWDSGTNHGNVDGQGYFTMTTNSLNWTAVPEPTSALAGLLITAGLLHRRRA